MRLTGNPLLKWTIVIVAIVVAVAFIGGSDDKQSNTIQSLPRPEDMASGDTNEETLRQLSAHIRQSQQLNERLAKDNEVLREAIKELQQRPNTMVDQSVDEIEQSLFERLQQNFQDLLTDKLQESSSVLEKVSPDSGNYNEHYPIRQHPQAHDFNTRLAVIQDVSYIPPNDNEWQYEQPSRTINRAGEAKLSPIPVYTIPENAVLFDAQLMSTIIGRVPVGGSVRNPFTFDVLVGKENLASNGIEIPNIANMRMAGYAVGNATLQCTEGWIISATFTFDDGTIHTVSNRSSNASVSNMNTQALGQIKDSFGNPCIAGVFVTNAPKVLGGSMLLGGAAGAAQAYANMQTSTMRYGDGERETFVTGDHTKYLAGQTGARAADEALDWWKARMRDTYDVVYVTPTDEQTGKSRKLSISITQQIPIDYDPQGRKVSYVNPKSLFITPDLD